MRLDALTAKKIYFNGIALLLIRANPRTGQTESKKNCNSSAAKIIASPRRLWLHAPVPPSNATPHRHRLTVFYSGRVQGVGFRYTVKTVATGFEITGTVRNLADGRVELIAEGQHAELEDFRTAILDAGLAGFVRDEQVNWADAKNEFRGFEIVR